MLEAMKSLRDEMLSFKKASESDVVKTSASAQAGPKPGPSNQPDPVPTRTSTSRASDARMFNLWALTFIDLHFLPSLLKMSNPSLLPSSRILNPNTQNIIPSWTTLKRCVLSQRSILIKENTRQGQNEQDESSAPTRKPTKPQDKVPQEPQQQDTDPVFYREVDMSDLPSEYAEEVETFRKVLDLPDPREILPRSSTTVLGLDDKKGQQELRPRGPSAMLPLNPILKDAFEKFEQDFLASNLPEGKIHQTPASTAKYYKVGQPYFEDKLEELQYRFISPKPSGAPVGKVPQNHSTINFTAIVARTASSCNTVMEKCLHSAKATFKRVRNQILKGADPERAARCGYENACDYFVLMNKRIFIQQRALACLSKSVSHILQRELYTMGNTGLLRREAEMTLLQPHLGDSRPQELRNSPFGLFLFSILN